MNQIDLAGRMAIVTGAARGLGFAIAERMLASKAEVSLWDIDEHSLDAATKRLVGKGSFHATVVDVSDPAAVTAATQSAIGQLGQIDILVANAGIAGANAKTWDCGVEDWREIIDVNLTGAFLCLRAVVPRMVAQKYGRIVTMGSVAGKEGNPNAAAYSASKAGLIALTKSLARELAGTGVIVNTIAPGAVETDLFKQMSDEHIQYMLSKIPLGRFGKPEEVASLVAWLASEECSFTTGGVFDLSGGRATY
jgi:3-oxoacyl-[acyl-carrier protein] reductase